MTDSSTTPKRTTQMVIIRRYERIYVSDLGEKLRTIFSPWVTKLYNLRRTSKRAYIKGVKNGESRGTDSGIDHKTT